MKVFESFVDGTRIRWLLRFIWLAATIPCLSLSVFGLFFGGSVMLSPGKPSSWLAGLGVIIAGLAGLAGIIGALIRLSNSADDLATRRARRGMAKCFLSAGLGSSLLLVAIPFTDSLTRFEAVLVLVPFCLGAILFAGTIGIGPTRRREGEIRN